MRDEVADLNQMVVFVGSIPQFGSPEFQIVALTWTILTIGFLRLVKNRGIESPASHDATKCYFLRRHEADFFEAAY